MALSEITAFCRMKGTNSLSHLYNLKCFFLKVHFSRTCCKSLQVMTFYDSLIQISGRTFISCILKKLSQKQRLGAGFFLKVGLLYVEGLCLIKALNLAGLLLSFAECSYLVRIHHFTVEETENQRVKLVTQGHTGRYS